MKKSGSYSALGARTSTQSYCVGPKHSNNHGDESAYLNQQPPFRSDSSLSTYLVQEPVLLSDAHLTRPCLRDLAHEQLLAMAEQ